MLGILNCVQHRDILTMMRPCHHGLEIKKHPAITLPRCNYLVNSEPHLHPSYQIRSKFLVPLCHLHDAEVVLPHQAVFSIFFYL